MKKLIALALLALTGAAFADQRIQTVDSTDIGRVQQTGIVITNGTTIVTTNCVDGMAVQGITNFTSSADAGRPIKADSTGKIAASLIPSSSSGTSTNTVTISTTYQGASVAASTTWANLVTVTNTVMTGTRVISGRAFYSDDDAALGQNAAYARILEVSFNGATTNILDACGFGSSGSAFYDAALPFPAIYRSATATNIYVLQGAADTSTQGSKFRSAGNSVASGTFAFTNAAYITIWNIQ